MSETGTDTSTGQEASPPTGGWKSQSPFLKALLFVSLVCVAFGVYRCSAELVPSDAPRSIRVERATVSVPDSLLAVPADSVAALVTRLFTRGLREGYDGGVITDGDSPAWAVVQLHIGGSPDGEIELAATATSVLSGRRLAFSTASDTPDQLREMAAMAAADMTVDLGSVDDSEPEAE
ncbi:MAG TPA: hypothetical protein VE960_01055 [bacterium]|nr:hypothetical protein [bacterium]